MDLVRIDTPHDSSVVDDLRSRHRPDGGVIVVGAAPETRRPHPFITDILATLGARDDIHRPGRHLNRDLEYLWAWMRADHVEHLVVLDAGWLHPTIIDDIVVLVAAADINCWLVSHEAPTDAWVDALSVWPHRTGTVAELLDTIPEASDAESEPAEVYFPRVIDAAWPLFRHVNERALTGDDFAAVDSIYRDVFDAAAAELAGTIDEQVVLGWLRDRCDGASTLDEIVTAVRATQAGCWTVGWHLNVHVDQFRAVANTAPTRAHTSSSAWWEPIRWYADPARGAVAALTVARLGCNSIATTPVGDISTDGQHRSPNVDIPEVAHRSLRAQRHVRLLNGASDDDPLFVKFDGTQASDRWVANTLIAIETDTGRNFTGGRAARGDHTATSWASRLGISVQPLGIDAGVTS